VAGQLGAQSPGVDRYEPSAVDTTTIRALSACIDSSIASEPSLPTHLWPNPTLGVKRCRLEFVVRKLATGASEIEGTDELSTQLEALNDICTVIWYLRCDARPFRALADAVLKKWKEGSHEIHGPEAKWLTMITFVMGHHFNVALRTYLKDLVWHSAADLNCRIQYLQDWVTRKLQGSVISIVVY